MLTGSFNMKRDSMGHEPDRNDWPATPAALVRSIADACLDAETLAAWADGTLKAQAATAVEAHASSCARCMAVLAAMERTAPAVRRAPRLDTGAPVPLGRARDRCRHGDRHLGPRPDRPIARSPVAAPVRKSRRRAARMRMPMPLSARNPGVPVPARFRSAEPPSEEMNCQLRQESNVLDSSASPSREEESPARPQRKSRPGAAAGPPPPPRPRWGRRRRLHRTRVRGRPATRTDPPLSTRRVDEESAFRLGSARFAGECDGSAAMNARWMPARRGTPSARRAGLLRPGTVPFAPSTPARALATTADGTAFYTTDAGFVLDARARKLPGSVLRTVGQSPC